MTLRFAYNINHRVYQYLEYVKCVTPTKYLYKTGADGNKLIDMLQSGELMPDDTSWAENEEGEHDILNLMRQKNWKSLVLNQESPLGFNAILRRFPYRGLDSIRRLMRHGDR